jgi:hypothetical protein
MSFERVFGPETIQEEIFEQSHVKDLIKQTSEGFSTTIFAYGQTGSGKTFTITGPSEQANSKTVGLVPRALSYLFERIQEQQSSGASGTVRIQASYLEIYNENVYDLLTNSDESLQVRWSQERGFFVENLLIVDCDNLDDSLAVLEEGLRNRTTRAHSSNEHSSRSHSLMTIHLEIPDFKSVDGLQHRYGKICFVDLAGSEKAYDSQVQSDTFSEALSINKALLTLGKCISALADPRKRGGHIPFRDSKLTKLLSDSLSGMGSTMMIACISPAFINFTETMKTLRYALQAKKIHGHPIIQLDPVEEKIMAFKKEIMQLKKENLKLRSLLEADGKYKQQLEEIEKLGEKIARPRQRSESPVKRSLMGPYNALPDIHATDRKMSKTPRHNNDLEYFESGPHRKSVNLKRRSTMKSPSPLFDIRASRRKSKSRGGSIPDNRPPKSAATARVEELRKSSAPAGQLPSKAEQKQTKNAQETTRDLTQKNTMINARGEQKQPDLASRSNGHPNNVKPDQPKTTAPKETKKDASDAIQMLPPLPSNTTERKKSTVASRKPSIPVKQLKRKPAHLLSPLINIENDHQLLNPVQ